MNPTPEVEKAREEYEQAVLNYDSAKRGVAQEKMELNTDIGNLEVQLKDKRGKLSTIEHDLQALHDLKDAARKELLRVETLDAEAKDARSTISRLAGDSAAMTAEPVDEVITVIDDVPDAIENGEEPLTTEEAVRRAFDDDGPHQANLGTGS